MEMQPWTKFVQSFQKATMVESTQELLMLNPKIRISFKYLRDILCKIVTFFWGGGPLGLSVPDFSNHFQTFLDQTLAYGKHFMHGKTIFVIFGFFATFVAEKTTNVAK